MNYSAGPYTTRAPRNDDELLEIVGEDGHVVALVPDAVFGRGPTEAERLDNIRLLTAAPLLHSALFGIVAAMGGNPPDWLRVEYDQAVQALEGLP